MNRKGQVSVGVIVMLAVALIACLAIFTGGVTDSIGTMTRTFNIVNETVAAPAAGSTTNGLLRGQAVTNVIVINATSGTVIPASNYTIANYVVDDGDLVSTFRSNTGVQTGFQGRNV